MSCICIRVARSMTSTDPRQLRGIHDRAAAEQLRLQQQAGERRPQLVAQHGQEQVLGPVGALRLASRLLRFADEVLERVDVDEREDGAVDLVVRGLVGANLHPIPAPVAVLHLGLRHRRRLDDLGDLPVEIGHVDVRLDVVERPPDVGRDDVEDAPRLGRETADPAFAVEDDDRDVDGGEQVEEVAVDLR